MRSPRSEPLIAELEQAVPDRPFTVRFWDGATLEPTTDGGGPRFVLRSRAALAHMLRAPGQLGLGRAYVSGALDVDDLDGVLRLMNGWQPPELTTRRRAKLMLAAARAMGPVVPPRRPAAELRPTGRLHTRSRDARSVRHHYDVSNAFFALFLDRTMTYSCAFFSRVAEDGGLITSPLGGERAAEAPTLEAAQEAKLELTARKLGLAPGMRVLDVGCGWGSFVIHAVQRHDVGAVGVTLSEPQAEMARRRAREAGVGDRVDIRVMDYRALAGEQFDAIASIGMVEHVGAEQIDVYAQTLARLLRPGGRLLNHGISRLRHETSPPGAFSQRYVFPDGDPLPLSKVLGALERAGFVTGQVEGFGDDYAETLRHWIERFDANRDRATELAGEERVRVWRLYLRAARNGFVNGSTSIYQSLCEVPG